MSATSARGMRRSWPSTSTEHDDVALALEDAGHRLPRRGRHDDRLEAAGKARVREDDGFEQVALAADLPDRRQVRADPAALVADGVAGVAGGLGIVEEHLAADVVAAADAGQHRVELLGLARRIRAPGGQQLVAAPPDRLRILGEAWAQQLRRTRSTGPWRAPAHRAAPRRSWDRPTGRTPAAAAAAPSDRRSGWRRSAPAAAPRRAAPVSNTAAAVIRSATGSPGASAFCSTVKSSGVDARQSAAHRRQGLEAERDGPASRRGRRPAAPPRSPAHRPAPAARRAAPRAPAATSDPRADVRRPASGAAQVVRQRLQARPRHRAQHQRARPRVAVRRGSRQPRLNRRRGGELRQAALEERPLVVAGRQASPAGAAK